MKDKSNKGTCWASNKDSTGTVEKISTCPICSGDVQEVRGVTVKHFIIDSLVEKVHEGDYHICLNEECDVVYYDLKDNIIFREKDIKIPIWYKRDANPKYICYCNKVTEDEIIKAVVNDGAKNMKDIIKITGAMKNGECEIKNPLGKCCGPVIQRTISKALDN